MRLSGLASMAILTASFGVSISRASADFVVDPMSWTLESVDEDGIDRLYVTTIVPPTPPEVAPAAVLEFYEGSTLPPVFSESGISFALHGPIAGSPVTVFSMGFVQSGSPLSRIEVKFTVGSPNRITCALWNGDTKVGILSPSGNAYDAVLDASKPAIECYISGSVSNTADVPFHIESITVFGREDPNPDPSPKPSPSPTPPPIDPDLIATLHELFPDTAFRFENGGSDLYDPNGVLLVQNGKVVNTASPYLACCGLPVNIANGTMWHVMTDFTVRGRTDATSLVGRRAYVANPVAVKGDFGKGWFHA